MILIVLFNEVIVRTIMKIIAYIFVLENLNIDNIK
jgi:hypothetical protein